MTEFGRESSCTDSLKPGRFVSGVRVVAEAAYRRLTTPRGTLRGGEHEADYGLDLTEMIGSASTKATAASLPGRIKSELTKDERINAVEVQVTRSTDGPAETYIIKILGDTDEGPFDLQLLVGAVTVELLGIKADS